MNLQTKIEVLSKKLEDINSLADKYFEENFKDKEIMLRKDIPNTKYIGYYGIFRYIKDGYLFFSDKNNSGLCRCKIDKIHNTEDKIEILKLLCKNSIS